MRIVNIRRLTYFAPAVLLASAWASPALAGPTTKTVAVKGSVGSICGLSVGQVTMTVTKGSGNSNLSTPAFSPTNVTVFCNTPNGGTLSVKSTALVIPLTPATNPVNYILTVSDLLTPTPSIASYNTAGNPAATTVGLAATTGVTLAFTSSTLAKGDFTSNTTHVATITLGLTAAP